MKLRHNDKYFKWGLTAFLVLVAGAIFWIVFSNFSGFYDVILDLISILAPILYGCFFAYIMNPVMKFVMGFMKKRLSKSKLSEQKVMTISKTSGVLVSVIVLLLVIYALITLLVPNIISSLEVLLSEAKLQSYYNTITKWVNSVFPGTDIEQWIKENLDSIFSTMQRLLSEVNLGAFVSDVFSAGVSVVSTLFNFMIGIVAAVYILIYKEQLCAQAKKITTSLLRNDHADRVFEIARRTNRIFSGYVIGKILDALMVGIITYIVMLIMGMPYAILIATIVGITNIIPYFGPFIGAAPSALLLLIENPIDALYFIIFIVVLQMIDGNIIENRIMGLKLGISDFWVLVSILLFGGVFGFAGMLLGVPIFAVIYSIIADAVNKKLRRKRFPTNTELYYTMQCVDDLPVTPTRSVSFVTVEPNYDLNVEPEEEFSDDYDERD
ncbi:MAG: AI-2E family transporter [Ruminococcaceae bacterium]|nr:AI-2E family transporter [Oscillospiraceae bacterium]